jgi:uncharacterized protein YndB with AHSA1/START domain
MAEHPDALESMRDPAMVERVEEFGVSPDVLWEAMTDPDLLEEWFGPVEFDVVPGGAITAPGEPERERIGVVETVEPAHRIGFVWIAPGTDSPSSVELVIEGDDDRSILRVREVRIEPRWDARPAWFASSARGCAGARA